MRCKPSTNTKLTLFIVLLLVIDQAVKFTVKLNMELYQSIPVFGNWFIIHFIENPGRHSACSSAEPGVSCC